MHSITWQPLAGLNLPDGTLAMVSGFCLHDPSKGRWAEYAIYSAEEKLWYPADVEETGASGLYPPTHYIPIPSTDTICDNSPQPAIPA